MALTPIQLVIVAFVVVVPLDCGAATRPNSQDVDILDQIPADEMNLGNYLQRNRNSKTVSVPKLGSPSIRVGKKQRVKSESFAGIPDYIRGGHNITKLSQMLHRVITKYNITSMVDVPCRAHSRWMSVFLENVEAAEAGKPFKYFCVDSNRRILDMAASRMTEIMDVSVSFMDRKFWREGMPTADLVFCWEGLEKMRLKNVESFLERLRKGARHKYLLVGTSPSVEKNTGDLLINVKRAPFSYGMPMRIFKALAVDMKNEDVVEKHMYLYRIRDMRRG